jgi:hypothetical protein
MTLTTELYSEQAKRWPPTGRHILAQFDETAVVVYQAYRPAIGRFAAEHQRFGGEFSLNRMSWIKPNFLWMMCRSGWGTKLGQEVTLAIWLRHEAFESILAQAVHSSYAPEVYGSEGAWKARLAESPVRLQWDPDHDPTGAKQERRALQIGMSGEALRCYAQEWIIRIEDISDFVAEQRERVQAAGVRDLVTPSEKMYSIRNAEIASRLGINQTESK